MHSKVVLLPLIQPKQCLSSGWSISAGNVCCWLLATWRFFHVLSKSTSRKNYTTYSVFFPLFLLHGATQISARGWMRIFTTITKQRAPCCQQHCNISNGTFYQEVRMENRSPSWTRKPLHWLEGAAESASARSQVASGVRFYRCNHSQWTLLAGTRLR